MNAYQLIFMTIFVGVFTCWASACAAQTIKFKSVDHSLRAVGGLLFVLGITYPALSAQPLNQCAIIFIVLQIVVAIVAFWRGWVDEDQVEPKAKQA